MDVDTALSWDELAAENARLREDHAEDVARLRERLNEAEKDAADNLVTIARLREENKEWQSAFEVEKGDHAEDVASLRAEMDQLGNRWNDIAHENDGLRAEMERLRATLKPFADAADVATSNGETEGYWLGESIARHEIRVADLYQARAALAPADKGGELLRAENVRLRAEMERRDRALERVMIGGNHLATWRADRWPDYELNGLTRVQQCENALRILGATPGYDMWICWSTIMQVRDELAALAPADKGGE